MELKFNIENSFEKADHIIDARSIDKKFIGQSIKCYFRKNYIEYMKVKINVEYIVGRDINCFIYISACNAYDDSIVITHNNCSESHITYGPFYKTIETSYFHGKNIPYNYTGIRNRWHTNGQIMYSGTYINDGCDGTFMEKNINE